SRYLTDTGGIGSRVDDARLALGADALPSFFVIRGRGNVETNPGLVVVEIPRHPVVMIEPADADLVGLQNLAQLGADEVDDLAEVELRRDALLDAVDDGQLGGALLGFLQQSLRLVEEMRIVECNPEGCRDRGQDTHIVGAERVLALVILDADVAEKTVAAYDRHEDRRLALIRTRHRGQLEALVVAAHVEDAWRQRLPHHIVDAAGRRGARLRG